MSKYAIEDSTLIAIGDAIRSKTGTTNTMSPSEMATAIGTIEGGGSSGGGTGGSSRWESPEGGWTYGTSPWHGYYTTSTTAQYDYWNFDTTNCSKLTFTLVYLPNRNTSLKYYNYLNLYAAYGYLYEYGSNDDAVVKYTQIDNNALAATKIGGFEGPKGGKQILTYTLDVANYTVVSLQIEMSSYQSSSYCALYISDIQYK